MSLYETVNLRTVAGYMTITDQQYRTVQADKCCEASDYRFIFTGERSACVCGQHQNPVPLSPVLIDEC